MSVPDGTRLKVDLEAEDDSGDMVLTNTTGSLMPVQTEARVEKIVDWGERNKRFQELFFGKQTRIDVVETQAEQRKEHIKGVKNIRNAVYTNFVHLSTRLYNLCRKRGWPQPIFSVKVG